MRKPQFGKKSLLLFGALAIVGALVGLLLSRLPLASLSTRRAKAAIPAHFEQRELAIDAFRIFDLGVADINGDGNLDLFTSNHSARQSFLLGAADGDFGANQLLAWGLNQSERFPGLEDHGLAPEIKRRGLYIYWANSKLVFQAKGYADQAGWQGQADFLTPVAWENKGAFTVAVERVSLAEDAEGTTLLFQAQGDGKLVVEPQPPPRVGSPITITLAATLPLTQVFVGSERVTPPTHRFVLTLKDRHGLLWADFDGDARTDLFVSRGANLGLTAILDEATMSDELFLRRETRFERAAVSAWGFSKRGCAARQTGLVDVNQDNRLDIYIVCARDTPNQLWVRQKDNRFVESARRYGLDIREAGSFAWLDANGDSRPDLFWAGESGFRLFSNQGDTFTAQALAAEKRWVRNLAVADFDRDGDGDVFAASGDGNLLFVNTSGTFVVETPSQRGLAPSALAANWVDVDNDGLVDLFALPAGLFKQYPDHHFERLWSLPGKNDGISLRRARSSWFDAGNDGAMDFVMATQQQGTPWWEVAYLRNRDENNNHWLQIILIGPEGNREAMGARVEITSDAGTQMQEVGWSEGSHFSQGHYRLYFGLGPVAVAGVTVTWPDGRRQSLPNIAANQLLVISYPE